MSKGKPSKTSNTKDPVPRQPQSDDEGDVFMDEGSSDNEDHNLQFAAADFDPKGKGKADCKYTVTTDDYFAQSPKDLLADKFIYLPLSIENVKIWALFDSGCSFSSISPSLAKHLNLEINKSRGNIKLINSNTVKRLGHTPDKLEVTYNSKTIHS